jgi:1-acyl-sn-glycerol-3-phosphate acyltransferase
MTRAGPHALTSPSIPQLPKRMTKTPSFDFPILPGTLTKGGSKKPPPSRPEHETGVARRLLPPMTWNLAGSWLHLAYQLRVTGQEHIPFRGSCVFVANHTSHLDTLVLASQLSSDRRQRVVPIAAADLFFRNRLFAGLSKNVLNAVPFRRHSGRRHDLACLRDELVRGDWSFLIFPEGTRSRDGEMGPFRAGIGTLVAGTRVPVVPCHISGAFGVWPPHRMLPSPTGQLAVRFGRPLLFDDVPHHRSGWNEVAEKLHERVVSLAL